MALGRTKRLHALPETFLALRAEGGLRCPAATDHTCSFSNKHAQPTESMKRRRSGHNWFQEKGGGYIS